MFSENILMFVRAFVVSLAGVVVRLASNHTLRINFSVHHSFPVVRFINFNESGSSWVLVVPVPMVMAVDRSAIVRVSQMIDNNYIII